MQTQSAPSVWQQVGRGGRPLRTPPAAQRTAAAAARAPAAAARDARATATATSATRSAPAPPTAGLPKVEWGNIINTNAKEERLGLRLYVPPSQRALLGRPAELAAALRQCKAAMWEGIRGLGAAEGAVKHAWFGPVRDVGQQGGILAVQWILHVSGPALAALEATGATLALATPVLGKQVASVRWLDRPLVTPPAALYVRVSGLPPACDQPRLEATWAEHGCRVVQWFPCRVDGLVSGTDADLELAPGSAIVPALAIVKGEQQVSVLKMRKIWRPSGGAAGGGADTRPWGGVGGRAPAREEAEAAAPAGPDTRAQVEPSPADSPATQQQTDDDTQVPLPTEATQQEGTPTAGEDLAPPAEATAASGSGPDHSPEAAQLQEDTGTAAGEEAGQLSPMAATAATEAGQPSPAAAATAKGSGGDHTPGEAEGPSGEAPSEAVTTPRAPSTEGPGQDRVGTPEGPAQGQTTPSQTPQRQPAGQGQWQGTPRPQRLATSNRSTGGVGAKRGPADRSPALSPTMAPEPGKAQRVGGDWRRGVARALNSVFGGGAQTAEGRLHPGGASAPPAEGA